MYGTVCTFSFYHMYVLRYMYFIVGYSILIYNQAICTKLILFLNVICFICKTFNVNQVHVVSAATFSVIMFKVLVLLYLVGCFW